MHIDKWTPLSSSNQPQRLLLFCFGPSMLCGQTGHQTGRTSWNTPKFAFIGNSLISTEEATKQHQIFILQIYSRKKQFHIKHLGPPSHADQSLTWFFWQQRARCDFPENLRRLPWSVDRPSRLRPSSSLSAVSPSPFSLHIYSGKKSVWKQTFYDLPAFVSKQKSCRICEGSWSLLFCSVASWRRRRPPWCSSTPAPPLPFNAFQDLLFSVFFTSIVTPSLGGSTVSWISFITYNR